MCNIQINVCKTVWMANNTKHISSMWPMGPLSLDWCTVYLFTAARNGLNF